MKHVKTLEYLIFFLGGYPSWLKVLVGLWVILSAIILVGLLLANGTSKSEKSQITREKFGQIDSSFSEGNADKTTAIDEGKKISFTFADYFGQLEKLDDRFLERNDFVESLMGKVVEWEGFVTHVSKFGGRHVSITIDSEKDLSGKDVFVKYPNNWKAKLFALRKGDKVKFGTVKLIVAFFSL